MLRVLFATPDSRHSNLPIPLSFGLFFSNEYFGIKVDLDGKKKTEVHPKSWTGM